MKDVRKYTRIAGGSLYKYQRNDVFLCRFPDGWHAYVNGEKVSPERSGSFRSRMEGAFEAEMFIEHTLRRRSTNE